MEYKFTIKKSDQNKKHWLIVHREEKTDGFYLQTTELVNLQIILNKYLYKLREK